MAGVAVWRCVGVCFVACASDGRPALATTCLQDGLTPCSISTREGNDKILGMLIQAGCDVNTPNKARAARERALAQ